MFYLWTAVIKALNFVDWGRIYVAATVSWKVLCGSSKSHIIRRLTLPQRCFCLGSRIWRSPFFLQHVNSPYWCRIDVHSISFLDLLGVNSLRFLCIQRLTFSQSRALVHVCKNTSQSKQNSPNLQHLVVINSLSFCKCLTVVYDCPNLDLVGIFQNHTTVWIGNS